MKTWLPFSSKLACQASEGDPTRRGIQRAARRRGSKIRSTGKRSLRYEQLDRRELLAGDLQNPGNPLDVNNDLTISALDALNIINQIARITASNDGEQSSVNAEETEPPRDFYFDVTGSDGVTARDALQLINAIGRNSTQVTFRLANDTDPDQSGVRDEKTFDLGIEGKINFAGSDDSVYIGVEQDGELTWIDLSPNVDSTGYFKLSDRQMRAMLKDVVGPGDVTLFFSSLGADHDHENRKQQDIEIEILVAPPQPGLVETQLAEDSMVVLDISSQIYDPDSDLESLVITIVHQPEFGTLSVDGKQYLYDPQEDFFGTDFVIYEVSDGENSSGLVTLTLNIESVNDVPVITSSFDDQTLLLNERAIELPITVFDLEDTDSLQYVGFATVANHLHEIRSTYGLRYGSDELFNLTGLNEKWFFGDNGTSFFLLPDGELIEWLGEDATASRTEQLIAVLDSSIYDEPLRLGEAEPQILAPATVSVTQDTVTVIPEEGLVGEVLINIAVADSSDSVVSQFKLTVEDTRDDNQLQIDRVVALIDEAEALDLETTPAFLASVAEQLDEFEPHLRGQLTEMLSTILFDYEQTVKRQLASEDWLLSNKRSTQRKMEVAAWVQDQLATLKTNYQAALATYSDSLLADNPLESAPPLFVLGNDYSDPIETKVGDTLVLDFRTIHPVDVGAFYVLEGFDSDEHGYLEFSVQTGAFAWYVPEQAIGTHEFTIRARGLSEGNDSSFSFTVNVSADQSSLQLLTASPSAISDLGTDEVTLTARGAWHPEYEISEVLFYQDTDGDGQLIKGIDRYLGEDENGDDGWTWTGTPIAEKNSDDVTFFAISRAYTFSAAIESQAVSATIDVISVPRLTASVLVPSGDPVHQQEVEKDDVPQPDHIVRYDNGDSAVATSIFAGEDAGVYVTRYSDAGLDGRGEAKGDPVLVVPGSPWKYELKGDADGNLIVLASDVSGIDDTTGPNLWMFRLGPDDEAIGDPVLIAGDGSDGYTFTAAMNENGDGVIAWKETYLAEPVFVQTFTQAGAELGEVRQFDFNGGFHDGSEWDSSAINSNGDYVVAWENLAAIGNVDDAESMQIVQHGIYSWFAAINEEGWMVLANRSMQVLDPLGRLVGESVQIHPEDARHYSHNVTFASLDTLQVEYFDSDSNANQESFYTQAFNLQVQPLLRPVEVDVSSLADQTPTVGGSIEVIATVANDDSEPSQPLTLAYYLSHDDVIDNRDRLLGSLASDQQIQGGQSIDFQTSLTLPPQQDPFWNRGSTELRLLVQVVGGTGQGIALLPLVDVKFSELMAVRLQELDAVKAIEPPELISRIDPLHTVDGFIDPQPVQDQLYGGGGFSGELADAVNMFQLLGYQYLAGIEMIAERAPYTMRAEIRELGLDVSGGLKRFATEQFEKQQWEQSQIEAAEAVRDSKIEGFDLDRDNKISEARALGRKLEADAVAKIAALRDSQAKRELEKEAQWNREKVKLESSVSALNESEENIERISEDVNRVEFYGWGGVVEFVTGGGENIVSCASDPAACRDQVVKEARGFFDRLSRHYQELYIKTKNQLEDKISNLESNIRRVSAIVQAEINGQIGTMKVRLGQIQDDFIELRDNANDEFVKLEAKAKSAYTDKVNEVKDASEGLVQFTQSKAESILEDGLEHVDARIEAMSSPEGIIEVLANDLQTLDQNNPLGSVQEIADSIEMAAGYATDVLSDVKEQLEPAVDSVKQAGGEFADWAKDTGGEVSQLVKDNLLSVFDQELIAYKVETGFDLTLNLVNGSLFVDANIAPGVDYDSRKLFDLLQGDISFPDLDPIEVITNVLGVELLVTNNYDDIRDDQHSAFGATNVYFASERFVEYFGGETMLGDAAELVATFGGSAKDALKDFANHLRMELNDLFSWLKQKGEAQWEAIVPGIIKALLTQQPFESPHLELKWTPVTYRYELDLTSAGGKLGDLNPLAQLSSDEVLDTPYVKSLIDGLDLNVDSPHAAFTLVWKIPEGEDIPTLEDMDATIDGYLDDFDFDEFSTPTLTAELVDLAVRELREQGLPDLTVEILGELANVMLGARSYEGVIAGQLLDRLDLDVDFIRSEFDDLRDFANDSFDLDLRDTPAGERLASFFDRITFGNVGKASLDEFSFDLTTFTVKVSGTLCHKHSWGSLADLVSL
ncbi:Ig-like domain-containing protein [Rubripirellula amarantea]|nr:Ig-like domain-containing protein [Rubripirellula amarantea]